MADDKPAIDPELIAMLGSTATPKPQQLDAAPPFPKPKTKPKPPPVPEPEEIAEAPEPEPVEDEEEEPPKRDPPPPIVEPELKPASAELAKMPKNVEFAKTQKMPAEETEDVISLQVQKLLSKYGEVLDTIVSQYGKDRTQIEQSISFLDTVVRSNVGAKGTSPYVDAWASLLVAKAEINSNATSALDSIAKLLAAGKSNDLIINLGGVQKGSLDLEALLSQPKRDDERDAPQ